jgi:Flp pilus assembly protein TadG
MTIPRTTISRDVLHDERGVIIGFVVRTMLIFALLGVIAFDAGQVVVDQIKAGDVAHTAALAAADAYFTTKNEAQAKAAGIAAAAAADPTVTVISIQVASDGTATVTVTRPATTLIVQRVSFLRHFGVQTATDESGHVA